MIWIGVAAFALVLCTGVLPAQQPATNSLLVTVMDPSGAVIPGAGIRTTDQATGQLFEGVADQAGQAELHLPNGNLTVRVQARGFATWSSAGFDPACQTQLRVVMGLPTDDMVCSPCIGPPPYVTPEDSVQGSVPAVAAEISVLPLQTLSLRAKRLRLKAHAG